MAWIRRTTAPGGILVVTGVLIAGCGLVGGDSEQADNPASASAPTSVSAPASSAATTTSPRPSTAAPATPPRPAPPCPTPVPEFVTAAPGKGKTVALTFDDGPGPWEADILRILRERNVRATFFYTGANAVAHPEVVAQAAREGHLIANHSYDHDYPARVKGGWTSAYLTNQLTRTNTVLAAHSGNRVCFFRPPGGYRTNVLAAAKKQKMTSALWSVDSNDWAQPGTTTKKATTAIVTAATTVGQRQHPIVLLHSTKASHEPDSKVSPYRGNTVAALPAIIDWYTAHGYRFVDLAGGSGVTQ